MTAAPYRYEVRFIGTVTAESDEEAIERAMDEVWAGNADDCDVEVDREEEA